MKKALKITLVLVAVAVLLSVFALAAFAVPSYEHKNGPTNTCKSHTNKLVTLDDIADHPVIGNSSVKRLQKTNTTKNIPLVIIVIGFNNIGYNNNYNWGQTVFEGDKSLKQYYTDMSFGQFTFEPVAETSAYGTDSNSNRYDAVNDGIIHVTLDQKHDDWSLMQIDPVLNWNYNFTMTKAFINAIKKANAYMDFSLYDDNKNGVIENNEMALGFVVAGYEAAFEEEFSYNTYSFWSHSFSISDAIDGYSFKLSVPTVDGVKVDSYIGIAENLEAGTQEPICVLAHELGHYLGLPDLYDTSYASSLSWSDYDVGYLSVMCSGSWGYDEENEVYMPTSMDAWSRYELGWIKPTKITQNGTYELTSQNYGNTSEKIKTVIIPTQNTNEYYLAENRQFEGWDKYLGNYFDTESGGIVLWHIDKNIYNDYYNYNQVNNTDHRPAIMPLYPETKDSALTFTGAGDVLYSPFFNSDFWNNNFTTDLGDKLVLPIYGKANAANKRASRTLSGIGVQFLDDCSNSMNIFVDVDSHKHALVHLNSQPTCLLWGYNDCYYCSYCKKYFTDSKCTAEMPSEDAIIPAKGHDFEYTETVKPGADADGYDLHTCKTCGAQKKLNRTKLVGWGQDKNGIWYYAKADHSFVKGWQKIKNKWYFFNKSGQMQTGWIKSSGKWYYLASSGEMKTGWVKDSGKWYYTDSKGVMQTGWIKLDGNWYYLASSGVMQTGWKKIDGNWYYFKSSGVMQTESLTYKGKVYKFKSNGICINP